MKLIIAGASGNVGKMLVPILIARGVEVLLLGRDVDTLQAIYPEHSVATYDALPKQVKHYDGMLYLAVRNNDQPGSMEEFEHANLTFLEKVLGDVKKAKLKFFIYPTSLHALKGQSQDPYSQTKFKAEALLRNIKDVPIRMIRLPAVYGERFSGKLAILNKVPAPFKGVLFKVLSSVKLTVSINKLADAIMLGEQNMPEFIITDQQRENWFYKLIVLLMDYGFALFVLIFLWWLILISVLVVKFTSKGPGIFAQTRVGQHGKHFTCYKLRTMKTGTEQKATHHVGANEVTAFGHFLRKVKIDELPQIFNIFKGEMSLIGPRPCLPVQEELVNERRKLGVLEVKPGITGWSQANGIDMSDPIKLALTDRYFIDMRTVPMLIEILFHTFTSKALKDNALQAGK